MIIAYLNKFESAARSDIDKLLLEKVSDALTYKQKKQFIRNLLQEMKTEGLIKNIGNTRSSKWILAENSDYRQ